MIPPSIAHPAVRRLILRDELALYRTSLANERTLLAYLRSGVALVIAGATMMHFAADGWFWLVGLLCVPGGAVASIVGIGRYRSMKLSIARKAKRYRTPPPSPPS